MIYTNYHRQQTFFLTGTTLLFLIIAAGLSALGFKASPAEPGTTKDADFWFLLQGSVMTLLSVVLTCIPLWKMSWLTPSAFWVWLFAILATACTIASCVIYTLAPTGWSALVAFAGSFATAALTIELVLAADRASRL